MYDFGSPLYDSLYEDPMAGIDTSRDPFNVLADPFEAMFDSRRPSSPVSDFNPFDYTKDELEQQFMDDGGKLLNNLEDNIEGSQVRPPEEPKQVELFEDTGWGCQTPSAGAEAPPSLGIYENPPGRPAFQQDAGPISHRGGGANNKVSSDGKSWCHFEDDYVLPKFCKEKDCEYFDPDIKECMYYSRDEFEDIGKTNIKTDDSSNGTEEKFEF